MCCAFFVAQTMNGSVPRHRSLYARKSVFEIVVYTGTHETSITCASQPRFETDCSSGPSIVANIRATTVFAVASDHDCRSTTSSPGRAAAPATKAISKVLCRSHNRLHADRCYGAEFMEHKIDAAQQEKKAGNSRPARPDEVANPYQVCEPAATHRTRDTWERHCSLTRFCRRASGHLTASLRRRLAMNP